MTASVLSLLQPLKDRLAAATDAAPIPWQAVGTGIRGGDHWYVCAEDQSIASIACNDGDNEEHREPLARFFTAAPTDQAKLIAAIEAVVALHKPGGGYFASDVACHYCSNSIGYVLYPCSTVAALVQALGGDTA